MPLPLLPPTATREAWLPKRLAPVSDNQCKTRGLLLLTPYALFLQCCRVHAHGCIITAAPATGGDMHGALLVVSAVQ